MKRDAEVLRLLKERESYVVVARAHEAMLSQEEAEGKQLASSDLRVTGSLMSKLARLDDRLRELGA